MNHGLISSVVLSFKAQILNSRALALVFAFLATLIYGVSFTVAKEVMPQYVKPFGFIFLRGPSLLATEGDETGLLRFANQLADPLGSFDFHERGRVFTSLSTGEEIDVRTIGLGSGSAHA